MRAAGIDTPTLPEDPAALRALLLAAWAERDGLAAERDGIGAERDALAGQNERLRHLLLKLKRRQFGRKSEQLPEDQLLFAFEEIEATLAANAARPASNRRRCAGSKRSGAGPAVAACRRTCRASRWSSPRRRRRAPAAGARWWRSASMPRSGST